ncbi:MAG: Sulfate permease [uncultured Campylobacterales bacterium]|uniref:Sulfate permease n=1 Tax=uncultured Campylobacterales bacterium TaxID=352960 RepID=A0A6S6S9X2_9BACT|nr:MAG: Sulfate permease [uncultured Campylobacterales bacterium]
MRIRFRLFPFLRWANPFKNKKIFTADIIAGITVALVLIPQSMAYAQIAGLPPHIGLYSSFLPVVVASLWGSSSQLSTGPVALVSIMSVAVIGQLGLATVEEFILYSSVLAIMIGIIKIVVGALHMGALVDFISKPVIVGFTNAAAIIIGSTQIDKFFGFSNVEKQEYHFQKLINIFSMIPDTHLITLLMTLFSFFLYLCIKYFFPKMPTILIVVTICTIVSYFTKYSMLGGDIIGAVPSGLPSFSIPVFRWEVVQELMLSSFVIALLGFVEVVSIGKTIAIKTRQQVSANQEFIGQGISNIVSGLFQGYSVSGSFSRSALNFASGAVTGFSSIVTAIFIGVALLYLTPMFYHIPTATLGVIILMIVVNLISFKPLLRAWRFSKNESIIGFAVFFLTLFSAPHIENGILIGMFCSIGLYMFKTMKPRLVEVAMHEDKTLRSASLWDLKTSDDISFFRYDGDLYFGNTGYFEGKLLNLTSIKKDLKVVIINMESVGKIDVTGEDALNRLHDRFKENGIELYLVKPKREILRVLRRTKLYRKIGAKNIFKRKIDAIYSAHDRWGVNIAPLIGVNYTQGSEYAI